MDQEKEKIKTSLKKLSPHDNATPDQVFPLICPVCEAE
jgi:hypothetical protein